MVVGGGGRGGGGARSGIASGYSGDGHIATGACYPKKWEKWNSGGKFREESFIMEEANGSGRSSFHVTAEQGKYVPCSWHCKVAVVVLTPVLLLEWKDRQAYNVGLLLLSGMSRARFPLCTASLLRVVKGTTAQGRKDKVRKGMYGFTSRWWGGLLVCLLAASSLL